MGEYLGVAENAPEAGWPKKGSKVVKFGWRLVIGLLISAFALAACLSPFQIFSEENQVKTATVAAIPGLKRGAVVISAVEHESNRVSWMALTPEGEFDCDADRYLGRPACVRR